MLKHDHNSADLFSINIRKIDINQRDGDLSSHDDENADNISARTERHLGPAKLRKTPTKMRAKQKEAENFNLTLNSPGADRLRQKR